jgi:hypothetical protein
MAHKRGPVIRVELEFWCVVFKGKIETSAENHNAAIPFKDAYSYRHLNSL